ncbi:MAG: hypothetical protein LBF42_04095 [Puniceicoccales bacterium]|jgi:hypothetical protein|nr:hypothetical protein [Puniceicoccales bacterium]
MTTKSVSQFKENINIITGNVIFKGENVILIGRNVVLRSEARFGELELWSQKNNRVDEKQKKEEN